MRFDSHEYVAQVTEAVEFLGPRVMDPPPSVGVILGTGLGRLADEIELHEAIPYDEIPHFPLSTVESHHGRLLMGLVNEVPILALQGRFHLYEGYDARQVTFPVRVLHQLGVETLLIANAAGGMNPDYRRGDLMLLTDHINLQGVNPLTGPNVDDWGPRFPDMSEPYSERLRSLARDVAELEEIPLHEGVYVAVAGPNLETRAEYRFLRTIGADAVGMSTVPEVIVAQHMGMACLAVSVITDECVPETLQPVTMEDVLAAAAEAEPKLTRLFLGILGRLGWTD
ncbi:MAG: purine-nucleoside phosphorylase [Rubricoccaceae bacterium]|nr:purine-nucleoside phosphorylase [Rubricoccaceae bacterium]